MTRMAKKARSATLVPALLFLIIATVCIALLYYVSRRTRVAAAVAEDFASPEFPQPSTCIDCERQFGESTRWMGQSNKCYDCESDMVARNGGDQSAAYGATKVKCFDC